jgi:hypothetical protein
MQCCLIPNPVLLYYTISSSVVYIFNKNPWFFLWGLRRLVHDTLQDTRKILRNKSDQIEREYVLSVSSWYSSYYYTSTKVRLIEKFLNILSSNTSTYLHFLILGRRTVAKADWKIALLWKKREKRERKTDYQ